MARRRILDLAIGAAIALALIGLAPGHISARTIIAADLLTVVTSWNR